MGCKCKEKTYRNVRKYSDEGGTVLQTKKGLKKMMSVFFRVVIGIFLIAIVIITLPFFIVYIMVRIVLGKDVKIDIKKLLRLNERK